MRTFNVFVDSNNKFKAIKIGWSWPAFFFGSIWAIFTGVWLIAIIMLPIEIIMNFILQIFEKISINDTDQERDIIAILSLAIMAVSLSIRLWFGIKGNKWRENKLIGKGFTLSGSLKARDAKSALELHCLPKP